LTVQANTASIIFLEL